jgi:hypothetical protein
LDKAGEIELLCPDFENADHKSGELPVKINDKNQDIFRRYFPSIDKVKKLAEEHKVYWLLLKDEVYDSDGKPVFGLCEVEPHRDYVGECKEEDSHREGTYKITLKANVDLQTKQKEIVRIKSNFEIDINEDEFYYWILFHELGHTFKGSGKYHTGTIVCDKTKKQGLKEKQEELAEKYCLCSYRKWKTNTI